MNVDHYKACWLDGMPHWIALLMTRVEDKGIRATAKELGFCHGLLSRVLHRKTPGPHLRQRVLELWDVIECKVYDCSMTLSQCEQRQIMPYPTYSSYAAQCWNACRQCPNNPQSKERKHG